MAVGVFVDTDSLFRAGISKYHRRLDYSKFYEWIKEQCGDIYRAFAYGKQYAGRAVTPFQDALTHIGFECRWAPEGTNWNVGIAMDVVRIIERVDKILLASNDEELAPAAWWVKEQGVKCLVCGFKMDFPEYLSGRQTLKAAAESYFNLPRSLLLKAEKSNASTETTK